jgi:hypothetical protein
MKKQMIIITGGRQQIAGGVNLIMPRTSISSRGLGWASLSGTFSNIYIHFSKTVLI